MRMRVACLLLLAAWLGGCAVPSVMPPPQPLLFAAPTSAERPRLFYLGLALYSESWSENDVVELAEELQHTADYDVVPLIASNRLTRAPRKYPIADDTRIAMLVSTVTDRARPGDVVFIHISTHGARGMLARQIGNRPPTALTAASLARQLAPLAAHPTVIVLSACYSGSLIAALRSPNRIIITAARADRSSFGCAAGNRHTWFGEAELHGFAEPGQSLRQVFAAIRDDVARMERDQQVTPSEPQISVGIEATSLYDAPVF
jgi:hypothetical protein